MIQGGLDMSPGLFSYFASKDVGVFYMVRRLQARCDSAGDVWVAELVARRPG